MVKTGFAGNRGDTIRSDCFVTLETTGSGGIRIELQSKVERLFGDAIRRLCKDELHFFGIENATINIIDCGALEFVMAARIEAAVKQCIPTDRHYLPELLPQNSYRTAPGRLRRSRLYLPGNSPKLMLNAGIHAPDGIILDLEDSVAPDKKMEARLLVRNALRQIDFYSVERMVRINQLPAGLEDLNDIIPAVVNLVLIPKCETAAQVQQVDERIGTLLRNHRIDNPVHLMPIIESALGVVNAYEIASAAENVVALAIGLEDYTADLGTQRSADGRETFFARSQVVNAARAAGVQPIDSVFSDVADMEALRSVVSESKMLGFEGMGCIHPRQIKVIHEGFAPDEREIGRAQQIVMAFHEAQEKGLGVVSLGSKMIDPPVVKRAQKTIDTAIQLGKIGEDWRQHYGN